MWLLSIRDRNKLLSGNFCLNFNLQSCTITKQKSDSALYVAYGANMRTTNCHGCCKRWYFTFNNAECSSPTKIDGAVYQVNTNSMNLHRHRNISGRYEIVQRSTTQLHHQPGQYKRT